LTGNDCAVPQGNINDLHSVLRKSFVNLFADDSLICMAEKQVWEMVDNMNRFCMIGCVKTN